MPIKLTVTKQSGNTDEWSFSWQEDGSPAGYTQTSYVNKPLEIDFLGKKIVPADVPSFTILDRDYHIYLDNDMETWTQEYAYRLVETLKTLPVNYESRHYALFHLTPDHLADDITVTDMGDGYDVTISKDVFYYANPFLVDLDGVRGRLFSKRLHHAMTNFVTDFGNDEYAANMILEKRFGCRILDINYEELTKGITDETNTHFRSFFPSELVSVINMLEELPEGFHATSHLKYLIRRINGMPHPIYPEAAAVSWPVDNGYIEFTEKAFGGNNENEETLRLILHEKAHFLWAFVFSDEIKNEWIKIGGWYEDPNASDGWATTKDAEFVSAYAHAHNPNEDMAESIAFYLKNPDKLKSRAPEKYDFICNRIMHGTRYISKIPDHLTFEVLNLYPDYDYPGKIKSLKVSSTGAADADKTVTVEIELNNVEGYDDSASGAYVRLTSPVFMLDNGTYGSQFVDLGMNPVDETGHKLRGSVTISKYSKSGHWTAGDIVISDNQGYQRFEGQNDCVFDLYVNNSLEDTEAPVYGGDLKYTITDTIIEGHNARNLEVRFKASDNIGFQRILCRMQFPGSTYCNDYDGAYSEETGECTINIPITEYFRSGDYYLSFISLIDIAGNNTWYNFSMDENDYPIETIHIETVDPDTTYPEIDLQRITVYAEPTHPEAPDGETLVTISFYARDDKSGFDKCSYTLRDPQGTDHFEYFYHRNFGTLYFDGDPTVWEHYLIKVVLPQGSAPGIWGLARMTAADKAFNEFTYNFVETLIFEPDNDTSDYELFADIEDSAMVFGINSQSDSQFSYKWRIIHEESGLEISGNSNNPARVAAKADSGSNRIHADLTGLPKGDLILIVQVHGEDGNVHSVKTRRVTYGETPVMAESITLNPDEWMGNVGDTFTIVATVLPEDASDKSVVWSSSNENTATVDEYGTVSILRSGTCVITASTVDGSDLKAECPVMAGMVSLDSILGEDTGCVDVYNLKGQLLKKQCVKADINNLVPGVYIIIIKGMAKTLIIR
ncbi:MAG: Ig-like domain-containing protein [Duncaniella sp.]|nr:Ig-like domain-containing protein [Duncaniella sp.]